jgi:flagellar protein FlaG
MVDVQAINASPSGFPARAQTPPETRQQARVPGAPGVSDEDGAHLAPLRGEEDALREAPAAAFQEALEESVEELNAFVRPHGTNLFFSIERELGRVIVQVKDRETEEVIKQIPPEEAIALAKALDRLKGLLVQQEA